MKQRCCVCSLLVLFLALGVLAGATCGGGGITDPAEFTSADAVRGGSLYDKWWAVSGVTATEPTTDHSRWATRPDTTSNTRTGSDTWRCKECHGWDYKGTSGAYATGSHATGIAGIFGTTKTPQEVFDLLKTAHGFGTAGLSDADIWDLAKFVLATNGAQFDTDTIIDGTDMFTGTNDATAYTSPLGTGALACTTCHGADGLTIDFGSGAGVGSLADDNPWEFQHKVRFGHPGTAMPASEANGATDAEVNNVGTYAQQSL